MDNPNAIPVHKETISVRQILEAMERNGYEQIDRYFVTYENGKVLGACAIGQAALNLGVFPIELYNFLNEAYSISNEDYYSSLGDAIATDNDALIFSVEEIAKKWLEFIEEESLDQYSREFTVYDNGLMSQFEGMDGTLV